MIRPYKRKYKIRRINRKPQKGTTKGYRQIRSFTNDKCIYTGISEEEHEAIDNTRE